MGGTVTSQLEGPGVHLQMGGSGAFGLDFVGRFTPGAPDSSDSPTMSC